MTSITTETRQQTENRGRTKHPRRHVGRLSNPWRCRRSPLPPRLLRTLPNLAIRFRECECLPIFSYWVSFTLANYVIYYKRLGMWSVSCLCSNGEKHTENWWKTREKLVYQANYSRSVCDRLAVSVATVKNTQNTGEKHAKNLYTKWTTVSVCDRKCDLWSELWGTRSLLYRSRFLQPNTRWKALDENYKFHILLMT